MTHPNTKTLALVLAALTLTGCEDNRPVRYGQTIDRPPTTLTPVDASAPSADKTPPPSPPTPTPAPSEATPGQTTDIARSGTYDFRVPGGVTQVTQSNAEYQQFLLYSGVPAGTRPPAGQKNPAAILESKDAPFLVLTVEPDPLQLAGSGTFTQITKHRVYLLNGLATEEWQGYTRAGLPYSELVVSHGPGDKLHALAVAKDTRTKQAALNVLSSITWKQKS